jgi:1,4-alpha-glucan branching enzyme
MTSGMTRTSGIRNAGRTSPKVPEPLSVAPDPAAPDPVAVPNDDVDRLLSGAHPDPHTILGPHPVGNVVVVRALRPEADAVTVIRLPDGKRWALDRLHPGGLFGGVLTGADAVPDYHLEVSYGDASFPVDDPYRWLPTLGEVDLHLIGEGRHERLWEVLGSHYRTFETVNGPVTGTSFAVWAPGARGLRLAGDFNYWNATLHPMRTLGSSGVWELFVPGVEPGSTYKLQVLGADGVWREKADPMARRTEKPPLTASVVWDSRHTWEDTGWMTKRAQSAPHREAMSVYEVHLGSWRPGLSYRELAEELPRYVAAQGFTHVEMLPVAEHPYGGSWGYQVTGFYAPTARFGTPDDFKVLVDALHAAGIGVIVDWVPAHFPKDAWALAKFDGTALYEPADPRRGEHPDWGTLVFDVGRREVRNFLVANALYWLEEYHIDGLRVDAVASMLYLDYSRKDGEWLPNQFGGRENLDAVTFLQEVNATVYREHPGVMTIAEESTAWPGVTRPTHLGGLGFGFKWNMGWMNDTLRYIARDPLFRSYHHNEMTFALVYAWSENYLLPLSHDEVVHGKSALLKKIPGDRWKQLATLRALYGYMWAHPGKQLLFMGCELAQENEWSEEHGLPWGVLDDPAHAGVQRCVRDLNLVYRATPAIWSQDTEPDGFQWIDANDAVGNTFSFLRWGSDGSALACISNFSGSPHEDYRIGLPFAGPWIEVLNTDDEVYGGSHVRSYEVTSDDGYRWHGQPHSAAVRIPPLGTVWLVPAEQLVPTPPVKLAGS